MDAIIARNKMILSSALKHGTTRHLEASKEQQMGVSGEITDLTWGNNEVENVPNLIQTIITTNQRLAPALKDYRYDFAKRQFTKLGEHDERTASILADLSSNDTNRAKAAIGRALGDSQRRAAGIGADSGRAAILIQSLISPEDGRVGDGGILEAALNHSGSLIDGGLRGMLSEGNYADEKIDSLESRGNYLDAMQQAASAITGGPSVKTFNSWWHKTVGTMFHLSTINPDFKKVFDGVQAFVRDTARIAKRAEELAPSLIPQGFSAKPLSVDDSRAISDPIFKGSLHKHAFTNEELANGEAINEDGEIIQFGKLTPEQIGYFRQYQKAINQSLTDLTRSELAKVLRGARIPTIAVQRLLDETDTLQALINAAQQYSDDYFIDSDLWMGEAERLKVNLSALMQEGYAPLMRFGDYSLYFYKKETDGLGNESKVPVYFTLFESERERNAAEAGIHAALEEQHGDLEVEAGIIPKERDQLYDGLSICRRSFYAFKLVS